MYVKATGRQDSVYLETYFITLYSLFVRLSHGIPGHHELTSIRYAIFAPGSASIPHGAARWFSKRSFIQHGAACTRSCCTPPCLSLTHVTRIAVLLLNIRGKETLHLPSVVRKMECIFPRPSTCSMEITVITRKSVSAHANLSIVSAIADV